MSVLKKLAEGKKEFKEEEKKEKEKESENKKELKLYDFLFENKTKKLIGKIKKIDGQIIFVLVNNLKLVSKKIFDYKIIDIKYYNITRKVYVEVKK